MADACGPQFLSNTDAVEEKVPRYRILEDQALAAGELVSGSEVHSWGSAG